MATGQSRQTLHVSVRFGVYRVAKGATGVEESQTPFRKWIQSLSLAAISGGLAALVSNPFFIVKTRYQSAASSSVAVGEQHVLSGGVIGTLRSIWRSDGVLGLFRGLSAFAPRVIVASAVQLSTYDAVKEWFTRRTPMREGLPLVIASSFVTGALGLWATQTTSHAARAHKLV